MMFHVPGQSEFSFERNRESHCPPVISAMEVVRFLRSDCQGYVIDIQAGLKLGDIPAVQDYPEIFPEELPGLPPDREIEFTIELVRGTTPIFKTP